MKRPRNNQGEMTFPESTFQFKPLHMRRVLCVFPKYAWSFATFNYAFPLVGNVKAFMPPQGLLLIAALMPEEWQTRFIDENTQPATEDDMRWADAVFTSGMHIQRESICDVIDRAHRAGRSVVLGGASASSAPEWYPEADIIHVGEVGDATFKDRQGSGFHHNAPSQTLPVQQLDRFSFSARLTNKSIGIFICNAYS